jgi:hypothetical protein
MQKLAISIHRYLLVSAIFFGLGISNSFADKKPRGDTSKSDSGSIPEKTREELKVEKFKAALAQLGIHDHQMYMFSPVRKKSSARVERFAEALKSFGFESPALLLLKDPELLNLEPEDMTNINSWFMDQGISLSQDLKHTAHTILKIDLRRLKAAYARVDPSDRGKLNNLLKDTPKIILDLPLMPVEDEAVPAWLEARRLGWMRIIPKSKAPARSGARPSELAAFVAELLTAVRVQDSTATPAFRLSRAIDALGKLSNSKLSVEDENQLRQRRRLKVSERLGSWIQSGALGTLILGMFFSGISAPIVSAIHDHVHFFNRRKHWLEPCRYRSVWG